MQLLMNTFESGMTALIMANEETNYIMEVVKSLKESGFMIKDVSKLIKNEAKKQIGGFLRMLLGTLSASLLGNLWTGKGTVSAGDSTNMAGYSF